MGQRKLDCYEAHWLSMAANAIRSLVHGCNCQHSWDKQFADLLAVADHGTTDGKPWTEPQPEIGEGYRVATEADASRRDRDMCDVHGRWIPAHVGIYATNCTYRVPIDRIPTDEDARRNPRLTVMVRNGVSGEWLKASLLAVTNDETYPFCVWMGGDVDGWRYCRFPYPIELN
jgi:hypothetical protein